MSEKKVRTDFYITQKQFKDVSAYAKKHGINNSEAFRRIIDAFFDERKEDKKSKYNEPFRKGEIG